MKIRWLASIAAAALVSMVAPSASLGASEPAQSPEVGCSFITEGPSDNAAAACEQGYKDATAHSTLAASCELGVEAITLVENEHDCKFGFIIAGGEEQTEPTASPKAVSECGFITEGAIDGSAAACAQGYEDALAGKTLDASCDHLGAGAITAVEYTVSCEDGWFDAKEEPGCIPGSYIKNGQPGSTIKSDAATDANCS
jgi:hypothetical protein